MPAVEPTHFQDLYAVDAEARERAEQRWSKGRRGVSWVLAFAGFAMLVILHEAGHFVAAKAVGMKVEKFYLFFPPKLASVKRGETEYGDRRDPPRGLREDHRHEPGRGDAGRGRAPRATTRSPSGSGSS